ncbi:MAG: Pr6Pr family membrane protein, partial [Clostridiaceae bacterium]
LKGVAMMGITVTWLVAHFMLGSFTMGPSLRVSIRLVHYVVPILTILDWLLFDKKGQIKLTAPLLWTVFPLGYFAAIMGLAFFGKGVPFYPYPFMNVEKQGLTRVLITVAVMLAFFIALGYLFILVDRLLEKAEGKLLKKSPALPAA